MRDKLGVVAVIVLLMVASPLADAAICQVNAGSISFGTYETISLPSKTSNGTIQVSCYGGNETVTFEILAGTGIIPAHMTRSNNTNLPYSLFLDPARTQPWGDGTHGTVTIHDSLTLTRGSASRTYNIYGLVQGNQRQLEAGFYQDQLVITLRY